ncbi:MAG: hypothetical protein LBG75_01015 [Candidatus Nomurabacteria bacterium]|nr:hypothetical protein [Candidatus Nomurabacteria bacterium]
MQSLETTDVSQNIQGPDASRPGGIDGGCTISPGVVVNDDNVLNFKRDSDEAYVNDNWSDNQWNDNSTVAFRDCLVWWSVA